jgi:hypothetical protein
MVKLGRRHKGGVRGRRTRLGYRIGCRAEVCALQDSGNLGRRCEGRRVGGESWLVYVL